MGKLFSYLFFTALLSFLTIYEFSP
jgi:hypothetical protein